MCNQTKKGNELSRIFFPTPTPEGDEEKENLFSSNPSIPLLKLLRWTKTNKWMKAYYYKKEWKENVFEWSIEAIIFSFFRFVFRPPSEQKRSTMSQQFFTRATISDNLSTGWCWLRSASRATATAFSSTGSNRWPSRGPENKIKSWNLKLYNFRCWILLTVVDK